MNDTLHSLRIYSHNVQKNYALVDLILESHKNDYDILFIQEPPWQLIRQAPSTSDPNGEPVVGAPIHPEWTCMVRKLESQDSSPRVMAFIHKRLNRLRPAYRRDIVVLEQDAVVTFWES